MAKAAILAAMAAGLGVAAACSSEANGAFSGGTSYDGGGNDSGGFDTGLADGFTGDASLEAGPDASAVTTAFFVQASPSLGDVRLCWSMGGDVTDGGVVAPELPFPSDGAMPGSNYPGVPLGSAASLSDAAQLLGTGLVLYAIDAYSLANSEQGKTPWTCDQLICNQGAEPTAPCLRPVRDYSTIPLTPSGALAQGAANVVALTGCLATALDPSANAQTCGPTWSAVSGNLAGQVLAFANAASPQGAISVEAAQLSPGLASLLGDGGSAVLGFGPEGAADASAVATFSAGGTLSPLTSIAPPAGLGSYGALGFSVAVQGGSGAPLYEWMSLAQSQDLVDPTQDPSLFYGQPGTYLVAVVGDPAASTDGGDQGKALHVLVVAPPPPPAPDAGD